MELSIDQLLQPITNAYLVGHVQLRHVLRDIYIAPVTMRPSPYPSIKNTALQCLAVKIATVVVFPLKNSFTRNSTKYK